MFTWKFSFSNLNFIVTRWYIDRQGEVASSSFRWRGPRSSWTIVFVFFLNFKFLKFISILLQNKRQKSFSSAIFRIEIQFSFCLNQNSQCEGSWSPQLWRGQPTWFEFVRTPFGNRSLRAWYTINKSFSRSNFHNFNSDFEHLHVRFPHFKFFLNCCRLISNSNFAKLRKLPSGVPTDPSGPRAARTHLLKNLLKPGTT